MFRSGFDLHLRMQNFEMNAMVAFNLFLSHLAVYQPKTLHFSMVVFRLMNIFTKLGPNKSQYV